MDAELFCQRAQLTPGLNDYLDEVAAKAEAATADQEKGASFLFAVAAYALYRLAKNYLDHQRGLQEAELRDVMLEQVEVLVVNGWKPKDALEAVLKVSKEISSLRPESSEFKNALTLLLQGGTSPKGE